MTGNIFLLSTIRLQDVKASPQQGVIKFLLPLAALSYDDVSGGPTKCLVLGATICPLLRQSKREEREECGARLKIQASVEIFFFFFVFFFF